MKSYWNERWFFFSLHLLSRTCAPPSSHTHSPRTAKCQYWFGSVQSCLPACLPPRFSYHYCLRSLIMHRSGSVHLLCVSRLPPLPSRGSYGFSNHLLLSTDSRMSNGRTVVVGQCLCRTKMDGFRFFPDFFLLSSEFAHLHQSLYTTSRVVCYWRYSAAVVSAVCVVVVAVVSVIILYVFVFCVWLCIVFIVWVCCTSWKVDGNFACFNLFVLLILKYAINFP